MAEEEKCKTGYLYSKIRPVKENTSKCVLDPVVYRDLPIRGIESEDNSQVKSILRDIFSSDICTNVIEPGQVTKTVKKERKRIMDVPSKTNFDFERALKSLEEYAKYNYKLRIPQELTFDEEIEVQSVKYTSKSPVFEGEIPGYQDLEIVKSKPFSKCSVDGRELYPAKVEMEAKKEYAIDECTEDSHYHINIKCGPDYNTQNGEILVNRDKKGPMQFKIVMQPDIDCTNEECRKPGTKKCVDNCTSSCRTSVSNKSVLIVTSKKERETQCENVTCKPGCKDKCTDPIYKANALKGSCSNCPSKHSCKSQTNNCCKNCTCAQQTKITCIKVPGEEKAKMGTLSVKSIKNALTQCPILDNKVRVCVPPSKQTQKTNRKPDTLNIVYDSPQELIINGKTYKPVEENTTTRDEGCFVPFLCKSSKKELNKLFDCSERYQSHRKAVGKWIEQQRKRCSSVYNVVSNKSINPKSIENHEVFVEEKHRKHEEHLVLTPSYSDLNLSEILRDSSTKSKNPCIKLVVTTKGSNDSIVQLFSHSKPETSKETTKKLYDCDCNDCTRKSGPNIVQNIFKRGTGAIKNFFTKN